MQDIHRSQAALKQAVSNPAWQRLGGKADEVQDVIQDCTFWSQLQLGISFLQPFSDFIHQIEADRPALGRCYQGLQQLDKHVQMSCEQWKEDPTVSGSSVRTLRTWERHPWERLAMGLASMVGE
jgi:hypothetical protein